MIDLEKAKNYLRVDYDDDDYLIEDLLKTATQLCVDVSRQSEEDFNESDLSETAILYTLGYLYEHRENADHHELILSLRSVLFPLREGVF